MKFSLEKFFYPIFFLLFLFSFFLIEGNYKFYFFASWSLFLFLFNFLTQHKQSKKYAESAKYSMLAKAHISSTQATTTKLTLLLSLFFTISTFFSTHLPASLEKLVFYLVSLAIFTFFSSLHQKIFQPKTFFYYLSVLTLTLNILVLFFTFYQDQQSLFPGMNLLVRSYGHNHYAAFLLLMMPVFWWQLLFKNDQLTEKENHFLMIVLLISSYLLMILSLARLALLISLIQLLLIFFINKKVFSSIKKDAFVKIIVKTFIFAFLLIGIVFLFLSIPLNKKSESLCPLIFSKKEICKPLLQNDRLIYWQKAWLIFRANPYFGAGLKNFNFASRQFPIKNYQITSYAHNVFLHNLAEGGLLVGVPFIFFILYIFYRSFLVMKISDEPLHKFLWLAAFSSLLNAMFDFDWHFFVIFTTTLIFIAIILQHNNHQQEITRTKALHGYYLCILVITVFFAASNHLAQIFYKKNQTNLIINYLPYSNQQVRLLFNQNKLQVADFLNLYPFYRNDPEFLYRFAMLKDLTPEKKAALQIEYAKKDPVAFITNINFDRLNFQEALPVADKYVEIVQEYNFINNTVFLDYWDQRNMAAQFFTFANQAYLAENPMLAANYYQKALLLNEFVMGDRRAEFLDSYNFSKAQVFLEQFKDFNPEKMGKYFYEYMSFYERVLIYLFKNNQQESFFLLSEAMFKQQYNFSWFLWRDLIAVSNTPEEKERFEQVHDHFKDMTTWSDFWPPKN